MNFIIDEELRLLIPPLSKEEYGQLEENIVKWGCLDPLKVWLVPDSDDVVLLDGHNRFAICSEHNVSYVTESIMLIDRAAAIDWMIANQLGRRNLSAEQVSYLRGKQYQQERQVVTNPDGVGGKSGKIVADQNDPQQSNFDEIIGDQGGITMDRNDVQLQKSTASRLAKEHGVSEGTIKRDAKYAEAVNAIANATSPEVRQQILSGEFNLTQASTLKLAKMAEQNPAALPDILEAIRQANNKKAASAVVRRAAVETNDSLGGKKMVSLNDFETIDEVINWALGKFTVCEVAQWVAQNPPDIETGINRPSLH
jgi:hypothetical protein